MSISRCITVVGSLYALMRQALGLNVATPLESQELSCTVAPDRRLIVLGREPIAGFARDHGTVANEAAMLALHTLGGTTLLAEPTFVAPGDSVLRADDPGWRWYCITNHGQTLADWERRPLGAPIDDLRSALDGYAQRDSPALTGTPTAPTPTTGPGIATKQYVDEVVASGIGGGGGGWIESEAGPSSAYISFNWAANGDANGVVYAAGIAGTGTFVNPAVSDSLRALKSTTAGGVADNHLTSRAANGGYTNNVAGSWLALDLKDYALVPNGYTLQHYIYASEYIRNWKLQGTNVCDWTVGGVAAANWTDLDTRTADTTIQGVSEWGHWAVGGVTSVYRYLRILQTGANSSGSHYLAVAQIEIYGRMVATTPVALPASARGWLTDGDGRFVPFY